MTEFEQMLRAKFSSIWDCDINHPMFCDTVGELMDTVIQAYEKCIPKSYVEVRKEETIDDLISRQVAIDAAEMESQIDGAYGYMDTKSIIDMLEDLPPAQPEIIRCKDCKHWINNHLCESLSRYGSFETKDDFYCGYAERK